MGNAVDKHVGQRIRQRRKLLGITQQQLAESVGVRCQQIQKYETGANRVPVSRLWMIAQTQETTAPYYFEGLAKKDESEFSTRDVELERLFEDSEAMQFVFMLSSLPDKERKILISLTKAISKSE